MKKIKVLKFYKSGEYDDEGWSSWKTIVEQETEGWEEISDEDFDTLSEAVEIKNAKVRRYGYSHGSLYNIVQHIPVESFTVQKILEEAREEKKKQKEQKEKQQKAAEARRLKKQQKKEGEERAQLEALKKKYEDKQ